MGKIVNQTELAEIIGKSTVTIWEWQEQGLPIRKRGAGRDGHEYDTAEVIQWLVDQALARAGKSKSALELELLELDVRDKRAKDALREKTLVPAEEVQPLWDGFALSAAAYMRARASQLAGELEAAAGLENKRALLRRSDAVFLTHLSGAHGERIQAELDALLEKLAAGEAEAFLRRIAGDDSSNPASDLRGGQS